MKVEKIFEGSLSEFLDRDGKDITIRSVTTTSHHANIIHYVFYDEGVFE